MKINFWITERNKYIEVLTWMFWNVRTLEAKYRLFLKILYKTELQNLIVCKKIKSLIL